MRLTDNRTGLDVLPRDECLRLLAAEEVGRFVTIWPRLQALKERQAAAVALNATPA